EDSYGYHIIKKVCPYVSISESTLYPILRRLEEAGMLTARAEEYNGRLRKYYHITKKGKERLSSFTEEWKEILSIYQFVSGGQEK
ncbi:MAG: PadR family transcriptional regulator, partial [Ruminococcaceae bacterium]|nr:PadR family transcriptional regulator [Oscillospiraceae bacterium]